MAEHGYGQFCPVAKGAEIIASRWTPLVLRELMCGEMSFNDIHRGVPRMSRAVLSERLKQLEADGIVAKVPRSGNTEKGFAWTLTPAGDALRDVIESIGQWGLIHGRQRVTGEDYDSTVLMWALRRRVDRDLPPPHRVVVRFDLSGVAGCRTGLRLHWLILQPDGGGCLSEGPRLSHRRYPDRPHFRSCRDLSRVPKLARSNARGSDAGWRSCRFPATRKMAAARSHRRSRLTHHSAATFVKSELLAGCLRLRELAAGASGTRARTVNPQQASCRPEQSSHPCPSLPQLVSTSQRASFRSWCR